MAMPWILQIVIKFYYLTNIVRLNKTPLKGHPFKGQ